MQSFLVGAFLVKRARLLQWLVFVFFFSSDFSLIAYVPLFVKDSFYQKYSVLDFERMQSPLP